MQKAQGSPLLWAFVLVASMPHTAAMDEDLAAELREQYRAVGCDEDTIDEALAAVEESLEPYEIEELLRGPRHHSD